MSKDPRRRRTVLLACKHTAVYDPAPRNGEDVYCQRCGTWEQVTNGGQGSTALVDYRADCRDCRYARSYGASRIETEVRAAAHRRRYPAHTVDLSDETGDVYATWHPPNLPKLGDATDSSEDVPPF
jgi:hypothetical protein